MLMQAVAVAVNVESVRCPSKTRWISPINKRWEIIIASSQRNVMNPVEKHAIQPTNLQTSTTFSRRRPHSSFRSFHYLIREYFIKFSIFPLMFRMPGRYVAEKNSISFFFLVSLALPLSVAFTLSLLHSLSFSHSLSLSLSSLSLFYLARNPDNNLIMTVPPSLDRPHRCMGQRAISISSAKTKFNDAQ